MLDSIMLMTDSYKVGNYKHLPPDTNRIYLYLEARKGGEYPEVMFFGLQYLLKRYFVGQVADEKKLHWARELFRRHFRGDDKIFNYEGWKHIIRDHGGMLPLEIKAVPEGMVIPEGNVLMTVENTCPKCHWICSPFETILDHVWYGSTVGTISRNMKILLKKALAKSGDDTEENLAFKLHDFGYRGVSSPESAAIGGAAHLVNFLGTDNIAAVEMLMEYYGSYMPGFSISGAAEHTSITSWGEQGEELAYKNMLEQFPDGIVAVVSDAWDIRNAVANIWGGRLRDIVLNRNGILVIRPDSGDPNIVLPELLGIAAEKFGYTVNKKGYKIVNEKVKLLQGDGVKRTTLGGMLDSVMDSGWSIDCMAGFGSGGGLLQSCDRDTQRVAMKCSYEEIDGIGRDVFKRPATDPSKNSKRGRLMLVCDESLVDKYGSKYATLPEGAEGYKNILVPVFRNGRLLRDYTLDEVRANADSDLIR